MTIPIIDEKQLFAKLNNQKNPFFEQYYALYSSWFGGIVKDPHLMLVPIDDHMVHRGDGVFEAIKAVSRSVYLMDEHLQRLFKSAEKIAIKPPVNLQQMKEIVLETLRAANHDDAFIRIFLSRGPGNFSVNPYDAVAPQLYVVITQLTSPSREKYEKGVAIGKSAVLAKPGWMAQVKSCNYLPNVLMKKEAVDRGLDFVISVDDEEHITESATENIMIVNQDGIIVHPQLDHILKGTTMVRVCELAEENGIVAEARSISLEDLRSAREVIITGTTLNVLPVVKFEGENISNGKPGPIAKKLYELLVEDIRCGVKGVKF
ncbi:MAG TPA: aminotransferase class IV [Gammaproteobacteria bacterium]|jgi:branched-chain amino acid aminotransferase|nr:aminotransferase class IV [Gammaproteobacteria bacterium]